MLKSTQHSALTAQLELFATTIVNKLY